MSLVRCCPEWGADARQGRASVPTALAEAGAQAQEGGIAHVEGVGRLPWMVGSSFLRGGSRSTSQWQSLFDLGGKSYHFCC